MAMRCPPMYSDFYPRPPRGGRQSSYLSCFPLISISIHALREEGDFHSIPLRYHSSISIHALREEGDSAAWAGSDASDISIHALREEGDVEISDKTVQVPISIHALREEGDRACGRSRHITCRFLSTPSARRATSARSVVYSVCKISIHALREEGDSARIPREKSPLLFLSTPSARRATLPSSGPGTFFTVFLSTPSARRATLPAGAQAAAMGISIHALREEGNPEPPRI